MQTERSANILWRSIQITDLFWSITRLYARGRLISSVTSALSKRFKDASQSVGLFLTLQIIATFTD